MDTRVTHCVGPHTPTPPRRYAFDALAEQHKRKNHGQPVAHSLHTPPSRPQLLTLWKHQQLPPPVSQPAPGCSTHHGLQPNTLQPDTLQPDTQGKRQLNGAHHHATACYSLWQPRFLWVGTCSLMESCLRPHGQAGVLPWESNKQVRVRLKEQPLGSE